MIARLVRLAVRLVPVGLAAAFLADRRLATDGGGRGPEPIRSVIVVDAPIERTWAVLADIERQPEWMHDLKSVRLTTPPPVRVGTRGIGRVRVFGLAVEDPVEVTAFEAPAHFGIRHDGFVSGSGDIRLVPGADGTTTIVTWDEVLVPKVFPHLGGRLIALVFAPIFQRDLERLAVLAARADRGEVAGAVAVAVADADAG
ncbi:MAG: SRPBCC family protein [Chloroflexi bacterium]|nr:SRPBCC family protein [Chloroflexota bacterium]